MRGGGGQGCRAVLTVLPVGGLPRYLYSVPAILGAFLLVAPAPLGEGQTDAEA